MKLLKMLLMVLVILITFFNRTKNVTIQNDEISKNATAQSYEINDEKIQHNEDRVKNNKSVPLYNKEDKSINNDNQSPDLSTKEVHKENKSNINKPKPKKDNQSTSKVTEKPKDKPNDKVTYGNIEYVDEIILYKKLEDKQDPNKDKGSYGVLTRGQDGLQRKEVRKVYVNGKYSHTETIKKTYIVKEPVHAQNWVGTKEETQKPKDTMIIDNESWYLYKSFSTDTLCIQNINALQEENFREWDGGSMCWGEHLYYSTGN